MIATISLVLVTAFPAAGPSPSEMAKRVDKAVAEAHATEGVTPSERCSDEDFLRRLSLDLTAELPRPSDVTRFGLSGDAEKREAAIDRLVASPEADARWARYWTETIFVRATYSRSDAARPGFESWITGEFRNNTGWDDIVTQMITASGDVRANGETGLIFAHEGDPAEVAAETARLFTGIQMSCANCHDHPSDQWKRTQFHELAAFFPRVRVRIDRNGDMRPDYYVESQDSDRSRNPFTAFVFTRMDRNRDGKVSKSEGTASRLGDRFDQIASRADVDGDGAISREEFTNINAMRPNNRDTEHYMSDLDDPTSKGEKMIPVFFATGDAVRLGTSDDDRRSALARSLTSTENRWFSRAIVNRYWHEMIGEGFYMPVDDLGPGREPMLPEVLDMLAGGFVRSGYDLRWLLSTIARTESYQRSLREPESIDYTAGTANVTATRLDADQLYGALRGALNVTRLGNRGERRLGPLTIPSFERNAFNTVFGEDPSTPKMDLLGSIPQALILMNSTFVENRIKATGNTRLSELLRRYDNNEDVVIELYLAVLGREPESEELATVLKHVRSAGSRNEGFEDAYWALINSAEFLNRR